MTYFHLVAIFALILLGILVVLVLAEPGLEYKVAPIPFELDSHEFVGLLASLVDVQIFRGGSFEVLSQGKDFYAAELAAIESARHSIHIEAFCSGRARSRAAFSMR